MTPSSILILSAYPPGVHQVSIEKALRQRGHAVFTAGSTRDVLADLEQALKRWDPEYRYDLIVRPDEPLADVLARCPIAPDMILFLESGIPFLPPGIENAPCPTIAQFSEDLLHADWYAQLFPYFDLALCTWKSTEIGWQRQGYDNVRQWYFGARPTFCVDEGLPRIYDVAFLGNLNPHIQRKRLPAVHRIMQLRAEGVKVHVDAGVYFQDYNRILAQSKIVFHRGITDQVNMRVFEAMAAGCLVIMQQPQDPDDPTTYFFRDREEVVYCHGEDDAVALIRHYLAHDDERRRIAEAGRQAVMSRHNYSDVARALMEEIVPAVGRDWRERRRERLARWGKFERRRHLDFARYYLTNGAIQAAFRELNAIPGLAEDAEAIHLLALVLAGDGQQDKTTQCLHLATMLDPGCALARVNRAVFALMADRTEADAWAVEALAALDAIDPARAPATALEGPYYPLHYDRFRIELARAYFCHPSGPERNAALARLYRYRIHQLLAERRLGQERFHEAREHIDTALAVLPDDGYLVYARAQTHYHHGDVEATMADLRRAIALEPFFVRAQNDLACCLEATGQFDEAFALSWDLVSHMPLVPTADLWRRVGGLARKIGRHAEARHAYEQVLILVPGDAAAQAALEELRPAEPTPPPAPPAQATIIIVGDDARAVQRALASVREHTPAEALAEVFLVTRGGAAIDAFLRVFGLPVTIVRADNWTVAAEQASGTHLVALDARLAVQPGWLPPLLAAAGPAAPAIVEVTGASHDGPILALCTPREGWRQLGGDASVRVVPDSVAVVASAPMPAKVATPPAVTAPVATRPISRGLKHVPSPPSQYFDFARPEVAALVPANARRILDVGCGGGALGALLKQRDGVEVWGIEAEPEAAERARTRLDHVITADLDAIEALPPDAGSFDCIICADVLEHLMDPERTLDALLRSLAPGGALVASIPNIRHQEIVLDLLVHGRWRYQPSGILDATHLRFFTATEIDALVGRLGLSIEHVQANGSEPDPALDVLATAVEQLGGDRKRFLQESRVIQYVFRARARAASLARITPAAPPATAPAPAPAARKTTSIVVLAWNELDYTRECVKSVLAHTSSPYELVLVDNGSADATLEFFRSVEGAKVVANGKNLGFAGGNNRGILAATGDHVVILNNDTLVTDGWLDGLLGAAEEDPTIGIVGPMSNYVSGPQLVTDPTYGDYPQLQAYAHDFRERHRGRRWDVTRLVGFCMLMKRDVIATVGLLDERFGLGNFEDDDYCLRAREAGFRLVIAGDVFIHHFGSRTFVGQGVDFAAAMRHGQQVFEQKWPGRLPTAARM